MNLNFFLQCLVNFQSSLCGSNNDGYGGSNGNVDDALIFSITELESKIPIVFLGGCTSFTRKSLSSPIAFQRR